MPRRATCPVRRSSIVAVELQVEARRLPGGEGPVAQRRLRGRVRRPEPRRVRRPVAQRHLVGERDGANEPAARTMATAIGVPASEPAPAERAVRPSRRRAMPSPANRRGREQRDQPRIGRLERRQQRLRPAPTSWVTTPAIDGTAAASRASPSQAIAAKARSPRATGGQRDRGERDQRSAPMAARPTSRSIGPPGR